ncbi:hypothetical protein LK542_18290 [Massilia sp. IC2-477]|uniref:hypothetical protein n=1 Tax=Massilia sp. IC2-477 TaxID=2887198 RepID=UPI001D12FD42|nr:hypothetical protein [Massilia sp. IC2-477]MCC2957571.1 hypothetical protein [Massilia sp. IC2-477]
MKNLQTASPDDVRWVPALLRNRDQGEDALDEALSDSFPASDPVALSITAIDVRATACAPLED